MNFFKSFGMGLLYFILSPFILAACVIIGVFGLFNHLVQFIIMLVHFFKGEKLFPTFKEDLDATQKLTNNINNSKQAAQPQTVFIQNNYGTVPPQPGMGNISMNSTPYIPVDQNGNPINPQAIPTQSQPQPIEVNAKEVKDNE